MSRRRKRHSWFIEFSFLGFKWAKTILYGILWIFALFVRILKDFKSTPLIGSKPGRKKKKWF